jgi:P-type Mg2+ transporter
MSQNPLPFWSLSTSAMLQHLDSDLLIATLLIVAVALLIPFTPLGDIFGFSPLPLTFLLIVGVITIAYILTAELAKKVFYKVVKF